MSEAEAELFSAALAGVSPPPAGEVGPVLETRDAAFVHVNPSEKGDRRAELRREALRKIPPETPERGGEER